MENNASTLQNKDIAENTKWTRKIDIDIEAIGLIDSLNEMAMQLKAQAYIIEMVFRDIALYGKPSDDNVTDFIGRMLTEPVESASDTLKALAVGICEKVVDSQ